jgi:hypothetical protein
MLTEAAGHSMGIALTPTLLIEVIVPESKSHNPALFAFRDWIAREAALDVETTGHRPHSVESESSSLPCRIALNVRSPASS